MIIQDFKSQVALFLWRPSMEPEMNIQIELKSFENLKNLHAVVSEDIAWRRLMKLIPDRQRNDLQQSSASFGEN